jgi:hypothetical protein
MATPTTEEALPSDVSERILTALSGLRFGAVEIQVHDSRVVRITRTEKVIVEGARPERPREGAR